MTAQEYLVNYGCSGDFARFREVELLDCRRGDRVVVRSGRGLELGTVMCGATERHGQLLASTFIGELLRHAAADDEVTASQMQQRSERLRDDACGIAREMRLPLEILDAEVLLDGEQAILHHLRWADFDALALVNELRRRHELQVALHDLAVPAEPAVEDGGCGRPDCGRANGAGSCATCGSGGGGCASGCGSPALVKEVQSYFAGLRQQMEQRNRVPLL
ncbi:MAG TPA: hypothetical protein VKI65_16400 [Gemmataceae bacterium]|nr:hypothetical protein [Gemmataceae bacterium]